MALALSYGDDDDAQQEGLASLQRLGARPAAAIVARRLRQQGTRRLTRGPRPSTRQNPAQLTHREMEVLDLLSLGLRNQVIAERLYVSQRTVDHHVASIFRKLGVRTRAEAATEAARLGLMVEDR